MSALPFEQGREARRAGAAITDNPYDPILKRKAHTDWDEGFRYEDHVQASQ